jgi:hypothetical protein
MSSQAGTTNVMDSNKKAADDVATASNSATDKGKEQTKKEKKPGFFARWKESTSKGYEKHRAAGGNL